MKRILWLLFFWSAASWSQSGFETAENCFKNQKFAQAKVLFETVLREQPKHLKSIEYLGDIESHQRHWQDAAAYYKTLVALRPSSPDYHYKYAAATAMQAAQSNKIKALFLVPSIKTEFENTLLLDARHIPARWALIELYLRLPVVLGGSEQKAQQYATELAKLSPVDGFLAKGHIAEYFERYKLAEQQYKNAIQAGNSATTYQKLADLYKNKLQQPEKAKALIAIYNEKNKS